MSEGLKGPLSTQFTLLQLQTGDASFFSATAQNIGSKGERVIALGIGNDVFEYWISYYFGAFMIYALDLRAIWLLPVFRVDIPADRLSFVLEGKQNACWFYSNRQITTTASHTDEDQRKRIYNERVQLLINGNLLDSEMESSVFSSLVSG